MIKFNKKAQSEIITTVLIILLVLAAIVIVWQVVSNTLKNTSDEIDTGAGCINVETTVLSAVSVRGTCNYIVDPAVAGAVCRKTNVAGLPDPIASITKGVPDNANCPAPVILAGGDGSGCAATWTVNPIGDPEIKVQRNSGSSKYNTRVRIFVDGIDSNVEIPAAPNFIKPLESITTTSVPKTVLSRPGQKVKAVTVIYSGTKSATCGIATEVDST